MRLLISFIAATMVVIAACRAQDSVKPLEPGAEDPALMKQLEEIDRKGAAATDLTAEFEQKKFTPMLKQPLVSTGTIKVKGAAVRWDTVKPEPSIMRIDEKELRIYYPNQRVVEVYPIGEEVRRMTASPLPRLAMIRAEFVVSKANPRDLDASADPAATVALELKPRGEGLKEHVDKVRVLLDVASGCATRVEVVDPDGERTVIVFSRIKINTGLKDSELALQTPAGVKVVNPLAGVTPQSPPAPKPHGDKP